MLKQITGFFKRGPSEREVLLAAIQALSAQSVAQQQTFQQWLGMFQAAAAAKPVGWTADEESVAIKEMAKERGIEVPAALQAATEKERVEWLMQQLDSEDW